MEVEDDGLVVGEEAVELAVGEAVRMLALGHQAEEIDDVDEADLEVGASARGGWRRRRATSEVGMSPAQAMTTSGSAPSSLLAKSQMPMPLVQCVDGVLHGRGTAGASALSATMTLM